MKRFDTDSSYKLPRLMHFPFFTYCSEHTSGIAVLRSNVSFCMIRRGCNVAEWEKCVLASDRFYVLADLDCFWVKLRPMKNVRPLHGPANVADRSQKGEICMFLFGDPTDNVAFWRWLSDLNVQVGNKVVSCILLSLWPLCLTACE